LRAAGFRTTGPAGLPEPIFAEGGEEEG